MAKTTTKAKAKNTGFSKESILKDTTLHSNFRVRLYFSGPTDDKNGRLLAGTPKHPDLIRAWLDVKGHSKDAKKALEDMGISEDEAQDIEKKSWCGFKHSSDGIFIEGRQIKSMLKTAAVNLKYGNTRRGYKQVIDHGFVVEPDRVFFLRENGNSLQPVKEADGTVERVQHIKDAKGRRSCISKYDYIDDFFLEFQIRILKRKEGNALVLGFDQLKQMLQASEDDGLGACRSQAFGRFVTTELEEI